MKSLKIFLPFTLKDIGGTSSFAKKFQTGLAKEGHRVFFDFREEYDILFLIAQGPFQYLRHAKSHARPIVQRLDGVYYWSVAGWRFPLMNIKAAITRHFFTDFTIYQSNYSHTSADRFLGVKAQEKAETIYNGVDLEVFNSKGNSVRLRDNPEQTVFFTASDFRREDQIIPLLDSLRIYRARYSDNSKLVIAGSFRDRVSDLPDQLKDSPNISFLGKVPNQDLPNYERASDVFLFSHLNPPCPNNVIEAISCGLPICGVADGAMPELIRDGKTGLLIPAQGTGFWRKRHFDTSKFADNLSAIVQNKNRYSHNCRQVAKKQFSLEEMASEYIEVFKGLIL